MKWIRSRNNFLNEAKLKDVILPKQSKEVKNIWGEEYLDLEEIEATEFIKQGKWKLSDEDKIEALGKFFNADLKSVYKFFGDLPERFNDVLNKSIDFGLIKNENYTKILQNFDIRKPSINQISILAEPIFKKIAVSETTASEIIVRDESGRPVIEDGKILKRLREEGEVIFSNNLVNINTFVSDFNRCFSEFSISADSFSQGDIQRVVTSSKEDFSGDRYLVEIDLFARDLFLSIKHNPKDILNISISRFYTSCQHLYSGGYRDRVIGNVFDPNSIPAYLIFDTPIKDSDGDLISEQLPLTRAFIRSMDNTKPVLYFDRPYPDRMESVLYSLIEKYSGNKSSNNLDIGNYIFSPDIPSELFDKLNTPYMDRLSLNKIPYIGINTKTLYLSKNYDWDKIRISPKANIREIVIESIVLPENMSRIPLNPDWVRIQFLKINNLDVFSNIKTDSYAFDKCKFDGSIIKEIVKSNPNLKKLQLLACDVKNLDFSMMGELDELQLIYTLNKNELIGILDSVKFKKLVLSSDLLTNVKNKNYINSLKSKGIKVEIVGIKI